MAHQLSGRTTHSLWHGKPTCTSYQTTPITVQQPHTYSPSYVYMPPLASACISRMVFTPTETPSHSPPPRSTRCHPMGGNTNTSPTVYNQTQHNTRINTSGKLGQHVGAMKHAAPPLPPGAVNPKPAPLPPAEKNELWVGCLSTLHRALHDGRPGLWC